MKQHLQEELTSEQIAANAGYSVYHFTRIFKEVTGVSPRQYLSAIRIQKGKQQLIDSSSYSVLRTVLQVGFKSIGTFSSRFKHNVGLSPKQFSSETKRLATFMESQTDYSLIDRLLPTKPTVSCHVRVPFSFNGIIFVGLFRRQIPDKAPVTGTVITRSSPFCTFSRLRPGTYYLMAAALPWSGNIKDYFVPDNCLRSKHEQPLVITEDSEMEVSLTLRKPQPYDPPILINLPLLLFQKLNKTANGKKI
ncbi:AraC family transcriptional regulator [Sediminibacillus dalangtanensis]|uniref:AraC family transcriptional regulator n=1 Tax=Sediminibacillus dalangtanensis TaxID=2729421 RepID=A0ABX7VUR1_9BACI|nr:helix-turn-helix transcriptional regulator [Sediminibacillus dalangtanensis]QTM99744.1 AraC family transcriptional regulator [Sediminibacillus dalangtanensis]